MEPNIAELERRYQTLFNDFQSGAIDEAAFIAEVDKLQFQDNWGRYWMIGAQTGDWHYYDGQSWHQADPGDSDKLPFMDAQGRYWQRGAKSGDWYYYQSETNEWVKPGQGDPLEPSFGQNSPGQALPQPAASDSGYVQMPTAPAPPPAAAQEQQFEADLFQDDDGRYWSVGAKSGQWYFYDENGWHPAHKFQARTGAQSQPTTPIPPAYAPASQFGYQPAAAAPYPTQPYPSQPVQPQQPVYPQAAPLQSQPAQPYAAPLPQQPAQAYASASEQAIHEVPATYSAQPAPAVKKQPPPPDFAGQAGNWFYHDGKQWLQYSSGEKAEGTPPDPNLIVDQESGELKPTSTPIVAEYVEEEEPPVEVVDVEVITVFEGETDVAPEPMAQQVDPVAGQPPAAAQTRPRRDAPIAAAAAGIATTAAATSGARTSTSPLPVDEVVPRREKTSPEIPTSARSTASPADRQRMPKRRTTSDPGRPVLPRKRAAHEPTIIIPTGSTTAPPSPAKAKRPGKPSSPVSRQKRARENTLPMEPGPAAGAASAGSRQRQVTQSMPAVSRQPAGTGPARAAPAARSKTQDLPAVPPAGQPAEKEGFTLGDALRAVPSTVWTVIAGVAVLTIAAVLIIGLVTYGGNFFGTGSLAKLELPTPTLVAGPPDSTPTPGPTPTSGEPSGPVATPTQAAMIAFSSEDLDMTVEHPENWQVADDSTRVLFSPSVNVLHPDKLEETSMLIGKSKEEDTSISDLLTEVLAQFPEDAENLNEGTISIGAQTWTSTQIRFDDDNREEQAIATLAVTSKDGAGYYLIAVSSASDWNAVQPVFQGMINSFRFGAEQVVAKATTPKATRAATDETEDEKSSAEKTEAEGTPAPTGRATRNPTPTPEASVTPLVYAVQSGDTMLGIAAKFGVDWELLASENGIEDAESLDIGQELVIPFTAEELAEYNAGGGQTVAKADTEDGQETTESDTEAATDGSKAAGSETSAAPAADNAEDAAAESEEETTEAAPVSGRIVYPAFNNGSGVYDVWMVDLGSGEQTPIAGAASQPAFNSDGSLLAYRSWDRGTRGIFFRDFIGGRGDIVTRFVEDALPSWSPDGYSFAFSSRKEGDRVPRLYVGNQSGDDPAALGFQGEYVSTMPDSRLVAKGCLPTGDCGMFVMGARGGGEKKISEVPSDTAPSASPDGNKIAFMSFDRGGNNWEVWVMGADGTNPTRLTENNNADGLPAWSPDGQTIAFVSNRGGAWAVWAMNADGTSQRKLFDMKGAPDGNVLYDEFNSRGWLEERISWAP